MKKSQKKQNKKRFRFGGAAEVAVKVQNQDSTNYKKKQYEKAFSFNNFNRYNQQ